MKRLPSAVLLLSLACVGGAGAEQKYDLAKVVAECAACHGPDGIGNDVEIPNLAGQHDQYLYTQLQHFKSGRRPHKEMAFESRHLTDDEMRDLARYYSQLPAR